MAKHKLTKAQKMSEAAQLREKIAHYRERIAHFEAGAIAGNPDAIREQSLYYQKIEVTQNRLNGAFSRPESAAITVDPRFMNIR